MTCGAERWRERGEREVRVRRDELRRFGWDMIDGFRMLDHDWRMEVGLMELGLGFGIGEESRWRSRKMEWVLA